MARATSGKPWTPHWLRALSCSRTKLTEDGVGDGEIMENQCLVVPGLGLGSLKLGLSLQQAIWAFQRRMLARERLIMERVNGVIKLHVPGNITLDFAADTQLLEKVTASWPWPKTGLHTHVPSTATRQHSRTFRLCRHEEILKVQDVLSFNFYGKTRPDSSFEEITDLQYEGISFTASKRCGVIDSVSVHKATCGAAVDPLCPRTGWSPVSVRSITNSKKQCTGLAIEAWHAVDGKPVKSPVSVSFGEAMQSVAATLGSPDSRYYSTANGDKTHSCQLELRLDPSEHTTAERTGHRPLISDESAHCGRLAAPGAERTLIFYNYFDLGLDVGFDSESLTVQRFVLHTNLPCHPMFGQYTRCPFRLAIMCCCPPAQARHPKHHPHSQYYVTPATHWPEIVEHNTCRCARVVGSLEYSGFSLRPDGQLDCRALCGVMYQYLFEVMPPTSSHDANLLTAVTILAHGADVECQSHCAGLPLKSSQETLAAWWVEVEEGASVVSGRARMHQTTTRGTSAASTTRPTGSGTSKASGGRQYRPGPSSEAPAELLASVDLATSTVGRRTPLAIGGAKAEEKNRRQQRVMSPRQTETSKRRQEKSHKFRDSTSVADDQKQSSAVKLKTSRSQSQVKPMTKTSRSQSQVKAMTRSTSHDTDMTAPSTTPRKACGGRRVPSRQNSDLGFSTPDGNAGNKDVKAGSGRRVASHQTSGLGLSTPVSAALVAESPTVTAIVTATNGTVSSTAALNSPCATGHVRAEAKSEGAVTAGTELSSQYQTIQEHAGAFQAQSALRRSPPSSPRRSGSPIFSTETVVKSLFVQSDEPTEKSDTDGPAPQSPVKATDPQSSTNRRSWAQLSELELLDDSSESLKVDDIRLETLANEHEDVASALTSRNQLLQEGLVHWRSGRPHITLRSTLGTLSTSADGGGGVIGDPAPLINLVDVCNADMSTEFCADMSADILPVIAQLLVPQQRLVWTEVLCRYVSRMVEHVRQEVMQGSALTRREATLDRTIVGLRRNLLLLNCSLSDTLTSSSSPISPLDSLPIAPAWRAALEAADSSECCRCLELLKQTSQHLSLIA